MLNEKRSFWGPYRTAYLHKYGKFSPVSNIPRKYLEWQWSAKMRQHGQLFLAYAIPKVKYVNTSNAHNKLDVILV
jgi:hypothetical protein